jgi:hypothetical protein
MKPLSRKLRALSGLLLISALPCIQAQIARGSSSSPSCYEVAEEVTVSGTVTGVLSTAANEMMSGSHLLIATPAGSIDASLGLYGLIGKGSVSVKLGEQVAVTGVMRTLNNRQVLIVRTVTAGGQVYLLRTAGGMPMSPEARERVRSRVAQNGGVQ